MEDAGGKKFPFKDTLSANTKQVGEVESWNEDLEIEVRDKDGAINYCPLTWKFVGFRALATYRSYFDGATIEHIIFNERSSPVAYCGMGKTIGVALQVQSHQRKAVISNGDAKAHREIRKDKATTRILRFKILEGYDHEVDIEEVEHGNKDYSQNIGGMLEQVP
ncbi:hypothetical protein GOBAR_AA00937 [Gossypium barbadense]|uniref:Uncharacterized protein n=1 Tax=Gossypium barbadense TaxID=3634 RepID=A0A2P5YVL1_GOSBA|nr:hypothetical protein GOBAR_AA00937 [Gossypium barbadense]